MSVASTIEAREIARRFGCRDQVVSRNAVLRVRKVDLNRLGPRGFKFGDAGAHAFLNFGVGALSFKALLRQPDL